MSYVMGDRPSRAAAVVAGLEGTRKLSSLLYRILQLYLQGSAVIVTGCRRPRPTLHTFSIFFLIRTKILRIFQNSGKIEKERSCG